MEGYFNKFTCFRIFKVTTTLFIDRSLIRNCCLEHLNVIETDERNVILFMDLLISIHVDRVNIYYLINEKVYYCLITVSPFRFSRKIQTLAL